MTMRTARLSTLRPLAALVLAAGAAFAPMPAALADDQPAVASQQEVDEAIRTFLEGRRELARAGELTAETYQQVATEALAGLGPDELTLDQFVRLQESSLLPMAPWIDEAVGRLRDMAKADTVDGATAAMLGAQLAMRQGADMTAMRRALDHGHAVDALAGPAADLALSPLARWISGEAESAESVGSDVREAAGVLEAVALRTDAENARSVTRYALPMIDALRAAELSPERVDAVRAHMLGVARAMRNDAMSGTSDAERWQGIIDRLDGAYARGQLVGHTAPNLTITWSSSDDIASWDDLKGSVVVLDFWATWCGPCIASFPQVRALQKRYADYDVVVVGVTSEQGVVMGLEEGPVQCEDDAAKEHRYTAKFMDERDVTWPVVFTEQNVFNPDYGVMGIPHVAIIDAAGVVRHRGLHPAMDPEGKYAKIDALLKEAGKPFPSSGPDAASNDNAGDDADNPAD